jgi:MFS family permease
MMNGFDGLVMGSINAMQPYHDYFQVGLEGYGTGIVFAIYSVGNLVGAFSAAPASGRLGRCAGMFLGSFFIVIGTIIEATAPERNIGQLMGGRFLIGFGMTLASTAAPVYLVDMAFSSWRGIFGGLYNVVGYYVVTSFSIP